MNEESQSGTTTEGQMFDLLSSSSKSVFAVAEAARSQLKANEVEIGHLLYALYNMKYSSAHRALAAAGINDENLLSALELSRLDPAALTQVIQRLSELPRLAAHTQRALEEANRLSSARNGNQIRMRHVFAGVLRCDDCWLVQKLKARYGVKFDLDALGETERLGASGDQPSSEETKPDETKQPPVLGGESDPVLLARVGATSIFVQETRAPWTLPVDAFTLFADWQLRPQGDLARDLEEYLGDDDWQILKDAIDQSREELHGSLVAPVLLVHVPDSLRKRGLARMVLLTEVLDGVQQDRPDWKGSDILRRAIEAGISRVTMPLTGHRDSAANDSVQSMTAAEESTNPLLLMLRGGKPVEVLDRIGAVLSLRSDQEFRKLSTITLSAPDAYLARLAIQSARHILDGDTWTEMSATCQRAFRRAAAAAGQKDGHQSQITPLHLLAGFLFGPVDPSQPLSRAFLQQAIEAALPPDVDSQEPALIRIASFIEVPLNLAEPEFDSLPPLATDARRAVDRALELRPAVRKGIHARDLIAGLLLTTQLDHLPPAAAALVNLGFDLSRFTDDFIGYIKNATPTEVEHWRALLNKASKLELAAPSRANIDNDDVRGEIKPERDKLRIANEVDRFARLLAARDVVPPISIGLFGNWGTGKTFFMGLLKGRIKALTEDKTLRATYVANVAQIDFNAWHYVDTNLWASLAMRIFDGLTDELGFESGNDIEETRRTLHSSVESSKKTRERAEQQQDTAKQRRASARTELARREAQRAALAENQRIVRMIRVWQTALKDPDFSREKKELGTIADQLGLPSALNSIDDGQRLFEQLRSIHGRAAGLAAAVSARFRGPKATAKTIAAIIVVLAITGALSLAANALRSSSQWLKDTLPQASAALVQVAALVSAAVAWASRRAASITDGLRKFEKLQATFQNLEARSLTSKPEQHLQHEIDTLDAEIQKSAETIAEADRRIAEAEAELQRINQGGLVYDFLKDRRQSSRYQEQLGLISTIRGDFERLRKLLDDLTMNSPRPIDRIILYIDDLDRCHPNQVVEVLQAVHLLLAFNLFSVVVGVDPRWLERSLCRAYVGRGAWSRTMPGSREDSSAFSAQNYLEKIFLIPYSLRGMSKDGFKELVGHLVTTRSEQEKAAVQSAATQQLQGDRSGEVVRKNEEQPIDLEIKESMRGPSDDSVKGQSQPASGETIDASPKSDPPPAVDTQKAIEALFLYDWEEEYMQALHAFIPTSRLAKRFVNVYRLLRVRATEKNFELFIGNDSDGECRAALLLLAINIGFPTIGAEILRMLSRQSPADSWSHFIEQLDPTTPAENRSDWAKALPWVRAHKAEFARLKRAIVALPPELGVPKSLESYIGWADDVGRYSFHWNIGESEENVPAK